MVKKQPSIRAKVLNMLSRREYSRAELEQKTVAWIKRREVKRMFEVGELDEYGFDESELEAREHELKEILNEFEERGWISDERFTESLLNQKAHRMGARRLRQELKQKGIHDELANNALEKILATEQQRATDVWQKKFNEKPNNINEHAKQMRFMTYRGFSPDVVSKIIAATGETDEE